MEVGDAWLKRPILCCTRVESKAVDNLAQYLKQTESQYESDALWLGCCVP